MAFPLSPDQPKKDGTPDFVAPNIEVPVTEKLVGDLAAATRARVTGAVRMAVEERLPRAPAVIAPIYLPAKF
jgi:hypothetical protein